MFLIKSCSSQFNIKKTKDLRIGTLCEYRETEVSQLRDTEEGLFKISFDLKDKFIKNSLFNHLNKSHNNYFKMQAEEIYYQYAIGDDVKIDYKGESKWVNRNCFIFCISKLSDHKESNAIFSNYDDYWFISYFKKEILMQRIAESLLLEIKKKIFNGVKVFFEDIVNPENLSIKSKLQEIVYTDRHIYLNNNNINSMESMLIDLFENIKFIKPKIYEVESELRMVFECYENDKILEPTLKSIIIQDNISDIINQSK